MQSHHEVYRFLDSFSFTESFVRSCYSISLNFFSFFIQSDLTSENTSIVTSKTKEMPITRSVERNAASLPNSPQRNYVISSHLGTQFEEHDAFNGKGSTRRALEAQRKTMMTPKTPSSTLTVPHPQMTRRSVTGDHSLPMRGRANTDVPTTTATGGLRQQGLSLNGSSSERVVNQYGSATVKPKCILPTTTCQPGYVTPSKLFNMMGYGIQNQYLFMLAHYLYIIDCRPREKFNESHIVTGKITDIVQLSLPLLFYSID